MLTYKDFETRTEFVNYLGLYHNNPTDSQPDFFKISTLAPHNYQSELQEILENIQNVRETWNNQSVSQIEQTVSKKGQQQIDIMQGQKTEKIRAGYCPDSPMYRVKNAESTSYFYKFVEEIGLTNSLVRYHVQFPGEVTSWHTDIFSPAHEFLKETDVLTDQAVGIDRNIRRILIALEPWDWGHLLVFGKSSWSGWAAGDVIFWDYGVPHGSANMGYTPRISVSITGQSTEQFVEICKHARAL